QMWASSFEHGDQGGTCNGNPLMCAAGLAVLEQVSKPGFLKAAIDTGQFLESELPKMATRQRRGVGRGRELREVRARGLWWALVLKLPIGASMVAQAFQAVLLLNSPQPRAIFG